MGTSRDKKDKVSEPTIYAWRKHFGQLEVADVTLRHHRLWSVSRLAVVLLLSSVAPAAFAADSPAFKFTTGVYHHVVTATLVGDNRQNPDQRHFPLQYRVPVADHRLLFDVLVKRDLVDGAMVRRVGWTAGYQRLRRG